MKILKTGIILLALLLAAMVMVPMVSALENSSTRPINNLTTTINMSIIDSKAMGPEFSVKNVHMTRQEFVDSNADYLAFLKNKFGLDQATIDKIVDREYYKNNNSLLKATTSSTIYQIEGYDIYLWPWTNTEQSTSSSSGSINLIFYGKTKSQMDTYMKNNALNQFHTGYGWDEYGNRGSSSSTLSWVLTGMFTQLEYGSYTTTRYHLILLEGLYSSSISKNWCYGQVHHEYWSDSDLTHYIYANGFDEGRAFVDSSISSSITRNYLNLHNYNSGVADGYGLRYIMA